MNAIAESFEELLVTPAFTSDPYPLLRRLRVEAPIYWSDAIGGWLITKYDDIVTSFKNTSNFSNENRLGEAIAYLNTSEQSKFKEFQEHWGTKSLLHSDPPDHTRMRAVVGRELNIKVVNEMKHRMQEVIDDLIDTARAKGSMDIVSDLASPLPINIIAQILGVPRNDRHLFKVWADEILAFQGVNKPSEADLQRAQLAIIEMRPYIREMIAERRKVPRNDLLSKFVAAEAEGGRISEPELISTCATLFVAGHETTISLISNTLFSLLSNPDQFKLLQGDFELLASTIEESLRYESPISRQPRYMKDDFKLNGHKLKKGDMVFQMINSANRDPQYFADPEKFDITRKTNRHLAFGLGTHFCVGAALAKAEASIAVSSLVRAMPNLQLIDPKPSWDLEKRNSRLLKTLEVKF